jgi:hypothetical protein
LRINDSLADKDERDYNYAEEGELTASDLIEDKDDKDKA